MLIGPSEGHGPCQQASMTSHRQCGAAEGRAVHCRHQGDEGAAKPQGKTGCQLNGSEISASQRGTGSPAGSWPPQLRQLQGGQHGQTTGHCFAPLGTQHTDCSHEFPQVPVNNSCCKSCQRCLCTAQVTEL